MVTAQTLFTSLLLALLELESHPSLMPSVACPITIPLPLVRGLSKLPIPSQGILIHVQTPGSLGMTFPEQVHQMCLIGSISITWDSTSSTASSSSSTTVSWIPTSPSSVPASSSAPLRRSLFVPNQISTSTTWRATGCQISTLVILTLMTRHVLGFCKLNLKNRGGSSTKRTRMCGGILRTGTSPLGGSTSFARTLCLRG
jgi:hypothetical protein